MATQQNPYQGIDNVGYVETEFNGSATTTAPVSNGLTPASPVHLSYCEKMRKHEPQSRSIVGGLMLLMGTGVHLAWGLWHIGTIQPWANGMNFYVYIFIVCSWYVAAIMGNFVAIVLVNICRKTIIYNLCATMLALSGTTFVVWYDHYAAILAGRMLAGMTHGIVYITLVCHAGENTFSDMRGRMLSKVAVITTTSSLLFALLSLIGFYVNDTVFSYSDMGVGIATLVFAGLGIVLNTILTYESVPYLLRTNGNGRPLVLILLVRLQSFLTNNQVINILLIAMVQALLGDKISVVASLMILVAARTLATVVPNLFGDTYGRKWFLTLSGGLAGLAMLIFGLLLMTISFVSGFVVLLVLFQTFVGLGVEPMQHVLISEAFSFNKKAGSVAFVTTFEYLLQIAAIYVTYHLRSSTEVIYGVFLATSFSILLLTIVLHVSLPETRGMTLKQTQAEFRASKHKGVIYARETNLAQGITYT